MLSKADDRKIRKFEETVIALREGQSFSITKLTSIKSLCKDRNIAIQFALYISSLTLKKVKSSDCPKYTDPTDWDKYKKIISRSVSLMRRFTKDPVDDNLSVIRNHLREVKDVQNETRSGSYGSVIRIVHSRDVLVIEDSMCCMLYPDDSSYWAYQLARDYTEEYNSSYGTGLIPESAPMLDDIISFWRKGEYEKAIDTEGESH